ncbi:hypothetical protein DM01DRAFT_1386593 [Hesseltinella vesiculosa]|uniref:Thioesterase/thiol ester dehydrase-isomerase n=1 Tax=Hesseltinella vesiculosa TaxID=101127 RepID=A0A1X2G4Z3_9FUNG|nr:hypothetical protein DM01DRAFT_1386593 [Hesseltinella vesiculosa]
MALTKSVVAPFEFDQATNTTFIDTNGNGTSLYSGEASIEWAIGSVPNVSYVVSMMLDSVLRHFETRHQKHPVSMDCFYLAKTAVGPFVVEIQELKMSTKGYCVCRAELKQFKDLDTPLPQHMDEYDRQAMVTKVYGVFTMGNMDHETGKSFEHKNVKAPSIENMVPFPYVFMGDFVEAKVDLSTFPISEDGGLALARGFSGSEDKVVQGRPELSQLMNFSDGRPIDVKCLPYWCDMFLPPPVLLGIKFWKSNVWCPTMSLQVQFKRVPTPSTKQVIAHFNVPHIVNNRYDLDGEIFDLDGNILAVTKHQCLVVDWSRNTKL